MRRAEVSYTNTYIIDYPNETIWVNDNNFIKITSADGVTPIGAEITITNTASGESRLLRHTSELHYLVFNLNDVIKNIYDYNQQTYSIYIRCLNMGISDGSFSFVLRILNGKSFTDRSHGVEKTIYVYDDDDFLKLQLWSHLSGIGVIGNQEVNINLGYNAFDIDNSQLPHGTNQLCLFRQDTIPIIQITSVESRTFGTIGINIAYNNTTQSSDYEKSGDIWSGIKTNGNYCINLEYVAYCNDFDTIKFRYTNTDGLTRYIVGRIVEETTNAKGDTYHSFDNNHYRNIPHRHLTSNDRTIKVVLEDVRKDAYISDILLSDNVQFKNYNGDWYDCVIKNTSITKTNDETEDYELEIILNKD